MTAIAEKIEFGQTFNPSQETDTFSPIPNWLLSRAEISFGAKCLYGRLRQYGGKDGTAFPKVITLAEQIGSSESQTRRYVRELEDFNLIRTVRRGQGKSNLYEFLTHIWMYPRGKTKKSEPVISDRPRPVTSDRSLPIIEKNTEETTATPEAVVVLPDNDQVKECLDIIPETVPVTPKIRANIERNIRKKGINYVKNCILYTNERNPKKYETYLCLCLLNPDWTEFYEPKTPEPVPDHTAELTRIREEALKNAEKAESRKKLAEEFLKLPEEKKAEIRENFLGNANPFTRRRAERADFETLSENLGFRIYLEEMSGGCIGKKVPQY